MNNLGIHEETPLDRAIVRQDEALQKQANECGNRLYAMCMELIEERCALKLENARLKHELEAMRLNKEHDEC
jgi:regulator of replication initiation timing